MSNYEFSRSAVPVGGIKGYARVWKHGRAMASHSKYSPQVEDRKHNFINRRSRLCFF